MNAKNLPLPPNRTIEQLRNHYEIEKVIASRLKLANRSERQVIYSTMYDELFEKVPDHSRLQQREDPARTAEAIRSKLQFVGPFLDASMAVVEFAPGDCRFAAELCGRVKTVVGIDISDQSGDLVKPDNFDLIVYDGYNLEMEWGVTDIVFSDQLLEHFHPEDTELHFELVKRILKPGGRYVLRTPHRHSGPHDVSRWFSDEPEGFHLKEWTYSEFGDLVGRVGYSSWTGYRLLKGHLIKLPFWTFRLAESVLGALPSGIRKSIANRLFDNINMVVVK